MLAILAAGCSGTDRVLPGDGGGSRGTPAGAQEGGDDLAGSGWTVRRAGPRQLVVSFVGSPPGDGPCGARLRAVAKESAGEVRLSVVDDNDSHGAPGGVVTCTAIGHQWALPVTLEATLGARRVTDRRGRVLDIVEAYTPDRLPSGYRFATEGGGGGSHGVTYVSDDGGWLTVATHPAGAARPDRSMYRFRGERVVDGTTFTLLEMAGQLLVGFDVDGARVELLWMRQRADSPAMMRFDELLQIAGSVS